MQTAGLEESRTLWEAGLGYRFGIWNPAGLVGRVALNEVVRGAFQNAYLGYLVDRTWAGRGVATEAVRLALDFAFGEAGLHRVQAAVMPSNAPSLRVVEKAGLRQEGMALRYLRIAGAWADHRLFAITAEEWRPVR